MTAPHSDEPDQSQAARLARENSYLAGEISKLEDEIATRLPSSEELAYIRTRMRADENAAWLWTQIRRHAPWVVMVGSLVGSLIVWLLTHTINIEGKP